MIPFEKKQTIRIASVVAATVVALGCGSNYAFSAWGPQFREQLGLSATQINVLSTSGNWGMYLVGIPMGILVDSLGARVGALLGAALLGSGYGALYHVFTQYKPREFPFPAMCLFTGFTGAGGCVAFLGAMKTAASNFPAHKGTATAFPLAAFGLSAFFFATVAGAINDDADTFLLFATIGATAMVAAPVLFLRSTSLPVSYATVPTEAPRSTRLDSKTPLKPKGAELSKQRESSLGRGTRYTAVDDESCSSTQTPRDRSAERSHSKARKGSEDSLESVCRHDDRIEPEIPDAKPPAHHSLYADVRGFSMLKYSECYELFLLIGLLTGIGLMTINNIGEIAKTLWKHTSPNIDRMDVRRHQRLHVSVLSICNFAGRLLSGIGSDFIVKHLRKSRFWCLFASSFLFAISQALGFSLTEPKILFLLSGTTGLAYGFLFGVSPTLVAETFGLGGFSQNWGFMTLAPAFFGLAFDAVFGRIYDNNSKDTGTEGKECKSGKSCYQVAYIVTLAGAVFAMFVTLWCIVHRHRKEAKIRKEEEEFDADHIE